MNTHTNNLDEDFDKRRTMLEKFPTARTFPQILAHGEAIGGFQELEIWSQGYRTV